MLAFRKYCSFAIAIILFSAPLCFAQEAKATHLHGIEILSGWGQANLKTKQDYHFMPLIVDFNIDLKASNNNIRSRFPGMLEFQIEPFVSGVLQPNHNIEIGNTFGLKIGLLPETYRFQPYIRGGVGGVYITQHIPEQSTQLNFCEHVGAGASYYFTKNSGVSFEFRYRHLSNADIKKPNKGISAYLTLMGITQRF